MEYASVIFDAIDIVNEQIIDGPKIAKSLDTELLSESSNVDSLSLVNLLVAIEDGLARQLGRPVSLVDENLISSSDQPLRTVGSLASYIKTRIESS